MSGSATTGDRFGSGWSVAGGDAGSLATRIGASIAFASLPFVVFPGLAVVVDAPAGLDPLAAFARAVRAVPSVEAPVSGALSLGVLGLIVGLWYLGVGLLLDRLYE